MRVRDVADAAGVNAATLHLHWKSKSVLYEAICRLHARELIQFAKRVGQRDPGGALDGFVDEAIEFLAEHPFIAPLAVQSVADQTPPEIPSLFRHDVSLFRAARKAVRKELDPGRGGPEPVFVVLGVFYFAALVFCDSPLQRALVGGSVYEDSDARERIASFSKLLVSRLMGSR